MKFAYNKSMKELIIEGLSKAIQLDDEDFERISCYKWYESDGWISRNTGFIQHPKVALANEVSYCYTLKYDHIDGDYFNNQKKNLRPCSTQENGFNRRKTLGCSSIYKGVSWKRKPKVWEAYITAGSYKYLGRFQTQEEAAHCYNEYAKKLFGEFAKLNKRPDGTII